jgi:hypothetical protein
MCYFGFHGLANPINPEMASAKTHGLTNEMHLGNDGGGEPNVLIYSLYYKPTHALTLKTLLHSH